MSRESVCVKGSAQIHKKLLEFDSSFLNFKTISIHCNTSCCHLASQPSAAVRVNGLNLVLFLPSILFPISPTCEAFAVVRCCVHLSVEQMQSNCVKKYELMLENIQRLSKLISNTNAKCNIHAERLLAGHVSARSCLVSVLMCPLGHPVWAWIVLPSCVLLWSVCVGVAVPSLGVFWDSDELRQV